MICPLVTTMLPPLGERLRCGCVRILAPARAACADAVLVRADEEKRAAIFNRFYRVGGIYSEGTPQLQQSACRRRLFRHREVIRDFRSPSGRLVDLMHYPEVR